MFLSKSPSKGLGRLCVGNFSRRFQVMALHLGHSPPLRANKTFIWKWVILAFFLPWAISLWGLLRVGEWFTSAYWVKILNISMVYQYSNHYMETCKHPLQLIENVAQFAHTAITLAKQSLVLATCC